MTLIAAVLFMTVSLAVAALAKAAARGIRKAVEKKRNRLCLPEYKSPTEYIPKQELDQITVWAWETIPVYDYDIK